MWETCRDSARGEIYLQSLPMKLLLDETKTISQLRTSLNILKTCQDRFLLSVNASAGDSVLPSGTATRFMGCCERFSMDGLSEAASRDDWWRVTPVCMFSNTISSISPAAACNSWTAV